MANGRPSVLEKDAIRPRVQYRIQEVIDGVEKEYRVMYEPFWMIKAVLKDLGYECVDGDEGPIMTNGWDVDFWMKFEHPLLPKLSITGNVYEGNVEVKRDDN
jgi:hypothetical protein